MYKHKILIVEDNLLTAEEIAYSLRDENYQITGVVSNAADAMDSIASQIPNLIVMDVELEGDIDGIELAAKIHKSHQITILYLTDKEDKRTVERAENIHHSYYMTKPFSESVLLSQVKLALNNATAPTYEKEYIFLKTDANSVQKSKVLFKDIVYLKAGRAYCEVFVDNGKDLNKIEVSLPLGDLLAQLNPVNFVRIHRSYAINLNHIEKLDTKDVVLNGNISIPLGEVYKQNFLERIA